MASSSRPASNPELQVGLIFFSSRAEASTGDDYRLLIESARFADTQGFSSLWVPERHFTKDGWLYPNPAVVAAALARETARIELRAGSVVVPLHHPARIVEEWAVVDHLSGGRVGLSFASGWHPADFVFFPERYADRHEEMYRGIDLIRRLWRGEPVMLPGGDGNPVEIRTYPPPLQDDLPVWVTAAGNPQTFERAGAIGANLLTHLFNHSVEELRQKIGMYRHARRRHGHDVRAGRITVMLHTFVTDDAAVLDEHVRPAFCDYLKSASYLLAGVAVSRGQRVDLSRLSPQDIDEYVQFVYERMVSEGRVLFGAPESCHPLLLELRRIGVDEIACQVDFGPSVDLVLETLPALHRLKEWCDGLRPAHVSTLEETSPVVADSSAGAPPTTSDTVAAIRARCSEEVAGNEFYRRLRERGIEFGTSFQGVERLWRRDGEALAAVELVDQLAERAATYTVHPAFLDACFQVLIAAMPRPAGSDGSRALHLPVGLDRFDLRQRPGQRVWSHAVVGPRGVTASGVQGDVRILDADGTLVAEAIGLRLQAVEGVQGSGQNSGEDVFYTVRWQAADLAGDRPATSASRSSLEPGCWLIFADEDGVADALRPMLEADGERPLVVTPGVTFEAMDEASFRIRPDSPDDMRRLVESVVRSSPAPLRGVVHLWSLRGLVLDQAGADDVMRVQELGCGTVLHLIQSLVRLATEHPPRVWLVTRGAQQVVAGDGAVAVAQAPLWGLGRALAFEHPTFWGGLVDLDPGAPSEHAATAVRQAVDHRDEDEVAFRQQRSYAARLVRTAVAPARTAVELRADARYLITGGLGDLGLVVARWMVERGARHLILLGRTRLPDRAAWSEVEFGSRVARQIAVIEDLEMLGANVLTAGVDITDGADLENFLARISDDGGPPIRGVVHAAATVRGGILLNLDQAALAEVMKPKIRGAWLLHRLLTGADLDFFVLFSAIPALLGWLGQGAANYAAANAFLDALAEYRRATGRAGLSIVWGPWAEVGLAQRAEGGLQRLASQGVGALSSAQGRAALDRLLAGDLSQVAVASIDWPHVLQTAPALAESPLLRLLVEEAESAPPASGVVDNAHPIRRLLALPLAERERWLSTYAQERVGEVLQIPVASLDLEQPLNGVGLDSLMAIELKNRLEGDLGVRIPMVTFLQGPSLRQLVAEVAAQLAGAEAASGPSATEASLFDRDAATAQVDIDHDLAERLLADLDQLSDEDVDLLLTRLEDQHDSA